MGDHLYQCIYDVLRSDTPQVEKFLILKRYKAKIILLHARRREKLMLDTEAEDKMEGEEPTLFHILKQHKRREAREIRMVKGPQGNTYTLPQDIQNIFVSHLTQKYGPIEVDETRIAITKDAIPKTCPTLYAEQLERPIIYDEILTALRAGARHKALGRRTGPRVLHPELGHNQRGPQGPAEPDVPSQTNHPPPETRIVVCLPKSHDAKTQDGYRPITLHTTEYKLLARIMARRLLPILEDHLRRSQ
jgi:hypothetical protein